ncbi:MAG TPA: hypothetical protein VEA36_01550 [Candidatus Paceibacterota bacterium]|nr:hypothetical protein [Candidatus Paceibacterota bacterium]
MRGPDLDRERSERRLSLTEFMHSYNEGLPPEYPRVSVSILETFIGIYPELFKRKEAWSLDQHRKRVMDWLPSYIRYSTQEK